MTQGMMPQVTVCQGLDVLCRSKQRFVNYEYCNQYNTVALVFDLVETCLCDIFCFFPRFGLLQGSLWIIFSALGALQLNAPPPVPFDSVQYIVDHLHHLQQRAVLNKLLIVYSRLGSQNFFTLISCLSNQA